MFKSVEELKEFITWAKKQKINNFKVDGVEVEFTSLAHIEEMEQYIKKAISGAEGGNDSDDDVLYHSGV